MTVVKNFTKTEKGIISTLLYFGLFEHPLRVDEIWNFNRVKCSKSKIEKCLHQLCEQNIVLKEGNWFAINQNKKLLNEAALLNRNIQKRLRSAYKLARILSQFPFVKGVALSGDLSKGMIYGFQTIDLCFIVKNQRLWLAYFILSSFLKIAQTFSSFQTIRITSILEEDHLKIEHEDIETAIEIMTLVPLYNSAEILRILKSNTWISKYFPNQDWGKIIETTTFRANILANFTIVKILRWPFKIMNQIASMICKKLFKKVRNQYTYLPLNGKMLYERDRSAYRDDHRRLLKHFGINSRI